MINRDPGIEHRPSARSFGDYGPAVAVPHVLAMLAERGVPASFYIPGWIAERHPSVVERIAADGHEIGHHGYLHEPPATLSADEEAAVLDRGSEILSGITGERPAGYRSPSWELSDHSLDLLRERGFTYDSSLMGGDAPYWAGPGLVELPIPLGAGRLPLLRLRADRWAAADGGARTCLRRLARRVRRAV